MKRIEDIAGEVRSVRGDPGPGPSDATLLATLAKVRRSRADRIRTTLSGLALGLLVGAALFVPMPRPDPITVVTKPAPAEAETDPMAALMLEAARIRLEGLGDPDVGVTRLRELVENYPESPSAREAEALLAKLEERTR